MKYFEKHPMAMIVIGVIGILFGFVTRQYVMEHEAEFRALEEQYANVK